VIDSICSASQLTSGGFLQRSEELILRESRACVNPRFLVAAFVPKFIRDESSGFTENRKSKLENE
jgi:hypothetical protein